MKKLLLSFVAALLLATGEGTGTAYAVDTCDVADPTGTPLNVRNQPNGKILFTLRNGTKVVWVELSNDQKWVKIFPMTGRHRDRGGLGLHRFPGLRLLNQRKNETSNRACCERAT
jgi:hypothetical protein